MLAFLYATDTSKAKVEIFNPSTEDAYDASALNNLDFDGWNRPIVTLDKRVFFQVKDTLYILSLNEESTSLKISYNDNDPVTCN